ncbi:MAG: sigma-54-dependent transcriptional regulator [Phocaeicola sp.]
MTKSILIVEDDLTFSTMLKTWLGKKDFVVESASNNARARNLLTEKKFDLVLSDLRLPDQDGLYLLNWLKEQGNNCPFIMMTSYAEIQSAVLAMKSGATDYIAKPIQPDILLKKIEEALAEGDLLKEQANNKRNRETGDNKCEAYYEGEVSTGSVDNQNNEGFSSSNNSQRSTSHKPSPANKSTDLESKESKRKSEESKRSLEEEHSPYMEGKSEAARQLYSYVTLVAPTPLSVLINGASGTGKEYVANRIHQLSKRADKPFVAIDCGSIPKELAASEFFGHLKGSFTGALQDKTGAFVEANGGTLFLDEVGNLSYEVQIQLLRALQERRIRPVGSTKEIEVDIRVLSATNENLQQAIERGSFREDLYHRLNEFTLQMPTLKECEADILSFANLFLNQANEELERNILGFDAAASERLLGYNWPGNLRELKNVVKRATLLAPGNSITPAELPQEMKQTICSTSSILNLYDEESEKLRIREALIQSNNNKSKAAILLGIDRKTLYNKLKLYNME